MSTKDLFEQVAKERLAALRFRPRHYLLARTLRDGIDGRLGLNSGSVALGTIIVQPTVSVMHRRLEEEIARRRAEPFRWSGTIHANLFEVSGREWQKLIVSDAASAAAVVDLLVDMLQRDGIPWMDEMATLEGLARGLEQFTLHQPWYRRPLVHRDLGDPDRAIELLDRDLAAFDGADTQQVVDFRRFARSIRQELAAANQA